MIAGLILSRDKTARDVRESLEGYQFHEAVQTLYHFFWDDFCDWYIELTKADVTSEEATTERTSARTRLLRCWSRRFVCCIRSCLT